MKLFSHVLFLITALFFFIASSQYVIGNSHEQHHAASTQFYKFRVHLKDKGDNEFKIENPSQFLSKNSIERKKVQNVSIDETDFPISNDYFNLLEKAGSKVVSHSK